MLHERFTETLGTASQVLGDIRVMHDEPDLKLEQPLQLRQRVLVALPHLLQQAQQLSTHAGEVTGLAP